MSIKTHQLTSRGAVWADEMLRQEEIDRLRSNNTCRNGRWFISRPMPYISFFVRLKQAWDVLRYKADALYWLQDHDI